MHGVALLGGKLSLTDFKFSEKNRNRAPGLDLFRFLAALVVFLGHAVFFAPYAQSSADSPYVQWFRTGTFAVDFFFVLSGYVLAGANPNLMWVVARYARLFPVYLVGVILGISTNLAVNQGLGSSILGVGLTVIGIQSLFASYALAVNGPLWSLSVEILLTPLFQVFWRLRDRTFGMISILLASVFSLMIFSNSPLVRAIPFFTLGALLRSQDNKRVILEKKVFNVMISAFLAFYLFYGASIITKLGYSIQGTCLKLAILSSLIYCLRRIEVGLGTSNLFNFVGKRTYVLYVIHGPIVGLLLSGIKPSTTVSFGFYMLVLIVITVVITEVVYRKVEIPAITWASRIKKTQ